MPPWQVITIMSCMCQLNPHWGSPPPQSLNILFGWTVDLKQLHVNRLVQFRLWREMTEEISKRQAHSWLGSILRVTLLPDCPRCGRRANEANLFWTLPAERIFPQNCVGGISNMIWWFYSPTPQCPSSCLKVTRLPVHGYVCLTAVFCCDFQMLVIGFTDFCVTPPPTHTHTRDGVWPSSP